MGITIGDILKHKQGVTEAPLKYWSGNVGKCDLCGGDFGKTMHDARTRDGRWGNLCDACFIDENCSAGQGHGQSYRKQADGRWLKVAG